MKRRTMGLGCWGLRGFRALGFRVLGLGYEGLRAGATQDVQYEHP